MEKLIFELQQQGLAIRDDLISYEQALQIRSLALELYQRGKFKQATIGKNLETNRDIRSDEIYWLDFNEHSALKELNTFFKNTIQQFNQNFFMGLKEFEGHFAYYSVGTFYKKHLDRHKGTHQRQITFLLYLNPDYKSGDGGELVIYDKDDKEKVLKTVTPEFGRVVFFICEDYWHEVLIAHKERLSLTGWFRI